MVLSDIVQIFGKIVRHFFGLMMKIILKFRKIQQTFDSNIPSYKGQNIALNQWCDPIFVDKFLPYFHILRRKTSEPMQNTIEHTHINIYQITNEVRWNENYKNKIDSIKKLVKSESNTHESYRYLRIHTWKTSMVVKEMNAIPVYDSDSFFLFFFFFALFLFSDCLWIHIFYRQICCFFSSLFWYGHVRAGAPSHIYMYYIYQMNHATIFAFFQLLAHKILNRFLEGVFDFQCAAAGHSFILFHSFWSACVFFFFNSVHWPCVCVCFWLLLVCWTLFFSLPIIDHLCIWKHEAWKENIKSETFGFIKNKQSFTLSRQKKTGKRTRTIKGSRFCYNTVHRSNI